VARIPTTQESLNQLERSNQGLQRRPLVTNPASLFGDPQSLGSKQQGGFGAVASRLRNQAASKPSTSVAPINSEYDAPYRGKKNERNAFLITTIEDLGVASAIEFWINPSECSWRVPLRTTIEAIQGGAVHHEWDATGIGLQNPQKFDQPVINFTFQSGNIAPYSWLDVSQPATDPSNGIPKGLGNFYDFLNLLNKPNITAAGEPNYVAIHYKSLMMPSMMLYGFFTQEGVQWTDNAENPNGISTWGASFVVFSSYPSLYENGLLRDLYNEMFAGN